MKTILFFFLASTAFAANPPDFPFTDWTKIKDDSTLFVGDMFECKPSARRVASYVIGRADGLWRLFGAVNQSESNRWHGIWMEPTYATPEWIYFGTYDGNEIRVERVEAWDREKHDNPCGMLFP